MEPKPQPLKTERKSSKVGMLAGVEGSDAPALLGSMASYLTSAGEASYVETGAATGLFIGDIGGFDAETTLATVGAVKASTTGAPQSVIDAEAEGSGVWAGAAGN